MEIPTKIKNTINRKCKKKFETIELLIKMNRFGAQHEIERHK